MRMRISFVLLVGLGLLVTAWGEEKAKAPATAVAKAAATAPSAEKLIEQLGDRDFQTREAAAKAIEALGPAALPALKKAQGHSDPEVRRRTSAMIPGIERAAAFTPKRINLEIKNKPIKEAIAALTKQTGYKITINNDRGDNQVYSFAFGNTPFWEAFDKVCSTGGLVLQEYYGNDTQLYLWAQDSQVPYVHREGPFRTVAQGFYYSKNINFGALPRNQVVPTSRSESMSFNVSVYVEPRLGILSLGQAKLTEAEDDKGGSLVPQQNNGFPGGGMQHSYYYGGNSRFHQQASINVAPPSKDARNVKIIKGTVPITLLVEKKPEVIVEKITTVKNKKFTVDKTELNIIEVSEPNRGQGKQYNVKLTITDKSKVGTNDYNWNNTIYQRIELQDAKGNKYMSNGMMEGSSSPGNMQGTFMFADWNGQNGPATKLVFYKWITMDYSVPFEFKNLPLP
ncbi:MAG TPA: HEAT repeat domain-containing protein [Gemmataceae bacterium]|nr:HEAT repeat domain-containing protein [Gemmataceae bacterium]